MMLEVFVLGRPATLTAAKVVGEAWKRRVAASVGATWRNPFLRRPVAVDLTFAVPAAEFGRVALHNLLKATIDGLSLPLFAPGRHGHQTDWNREDGWIHELCARKERSRDQGVRIQVRELPSRAPTDPLLIVVGRPAPWVTAGEAAWKATVRAAAEARGLATPPRSLDLEFRVESRWFADTDIDNLAVPVVAALCSVAGSACVVEQLHAWKVEAGDSGSGLSLWAT